MVTLGAGIEHLRDGTMVGLGVTSPQRAAAAPGITSFAETLAPGFAIETWMGVLAPAATPTSTITQLHTAILASSTGGTSPINWPVRTHCVGAVFAATQVASLCPDGYLGLNFSTAPQVMPNFNLAETQIGDVAAYILSLRLCRPER